jgi:hydroxymethylbilane synthase
MAQTLVIGTRGSKLALTQAHMVAADLRAAHPGLEVELTIISTKGDRILDVALSAVGDKGLFVKELEVALLDGTIDLAVHSGKDLPSLVPDGLTLAAFPHRADVRDVLVRCAQARVQTSYPESATAQCSILDHLPQRARVGTSSLRRACQLRALRPDLNVLDVRGNVDTRLRKLAEGQFDALVLAAAGLDRLGIRDWRCHESEAPARQSTDSQIQFPITITPIPVDLMLPAVAQGALAIEARADDTRTLSLLAALDDPATRAAVLAERAFLRRLEGGCQVPIAGHATFTGHQNQQLVMHGLVGSLDGSSVVCGVCTGDPADPATLGVALAEELLARGADVILDELRSGQEVNR